MLAFPDSPVSRWFPRAQLQIRALPLGSRYTEAAQLKSTSGTSSAPHSPDFPAILTATRPTGQSTSGEHVWQYIAESRALRYCQTMS